MTVLLLFTLILFKPISPAPSNPTTSSFKPNPLSEGWWVCAYCGKQYDDNITSCPCHVRKKI